MTTFVTILTFCAILGIGLWIGKRNYLKKRKKYLNGLRAGDIIHVSTTRGIKEAVFLKRYDNCEAKSVLVKFLPNNRKVVLGEGQIISQ